MAYKYHGGSEKKRKITLVLRKECIHKQSKNKFEKTLLYVSNVYLKNYIKFDNCNSCSGKNFLLQRNNWQHILDKNSISIVNNFYFF